MLLNAILLFISSSSISAMSSTFLDLRTYDNNVTHKYHFDDNFRLHKMHSTSAAKIFTDGCRGLYFNSGSSSATMFSENKKRTFVVENINEPIILGIFSSDTVSILLYVNEPLENSTDYVEITLGIDKNSNASISGSGALKFSGSKFVNEDNIPALPFYISISNSQNRTEVSELRLKDTGPFLTYTHKADKFRYFRIDHKGAIYSHYSCCELNCTRQVFHRISGCNKYTTQTATTPDKLDLQHYHQDKNKNKNDSIMFSGTYFVDHPENISFGARIKFYEYDDRPGDFYDIAFTDTYATISHYVNKAKATFSSTYPFPQKEHLNPRTINITISKSGQVSLSKTHESKPFLHYLPQHNGKDGLTVKYMSFAKLLDDSVRYDFYYNCSAVMTYFNLTPIAPASKLFEKYVPRVHESRFDLVQIFNETFNLNLKFATEINKAYREFEDVEYEDHPILGNNGTSEDGGNSKTMKIAWKTLGSISSFIFVGFLKWILSFDFIKNLTKDLDEEKVKSVSEKIGKGVSKILVNDIND